VGKTLLSTQTNLTISFCVCYVRAIIHSILCVNVFSSPHHSHPLQSLRCIKTHLLVMKIFFTNKRMTINLSLSDAYVISSISWRGWMCVVCAQSTCIQSCQLVCLVHFLSEKQHIDSNVWNSECSLNSMLIVCVVFPLLAAECINPNF
jgi:hypothetical protein